jgi:hypothetical protein
VWGVGGRRCGIRAAAQGPRRRAMLSTRRMRRQPAWLVVRRPPAGLEEADGGFYGVLRVAGGGAVMRVVLGQWMSRQAVARCAASVDGLAAGKLRLHARVRSGSAQARPGPLPGSSCKLMEVLVSWWWLEGDEWRRCCGLHPPEMNGTDGCCILRRRMAPLQVLHPSFQCWEEEGGMLAHRVEELCCADGCGGRASRWQGLREMNGTTGVLHPSTEDDGYGCAGSSCLRLSAFVLEPVLVLVSVPYMWRSGSVHGALRRCSVGFWVCSPLRGGG